MKRFLIISLASSVALFPSAAGATTSVVNNVSATASSSTESSSARVEATTIVDGKVVAQEKYFEEVASGTASVSVESEVAVQEQEGNAAPAPERVEHITPASSSVISPPTTDTDATAPGEDLEELQQATSAATASTELAQNGEGEGRQTVVEKVVAALRTSIETVTSTVHHVLTSIFA